MLSVYDALRNRSGAACPAADKLPRCARRSASPRNCCWPVDRGSTHGRRWPIGCVALEVTQRCNLDCTACYLSEHSEAVKDIPLEELFRRIDLIFDHYGPHTNVQVTGGEPTLRNREELVAIVRKVSRKGMRPALVTNGIRAKRECPTGCEGVHGRSRPLGALYARRCFPRYLRRYPTPSGVK